LPLQDEPVIWCCIDYAVSFGAQNQVAIRIEQPFVYTGSDGVEHLIVPEADPLQIAPVLAITRLSAREGFSYDDGHLEITFSDGSKIGVRSRLRTLGVDRSRRAKDGLSPRRRAVRVPPHTRISMKIRSNWTAILTLIRSDLVSSWPPFGAVDHPVWDSSFPRNQ
jgi:hypothetical protein